MFLVAYDVSDPARLRRMHQTMMGFGDPLQYSVFLCCLSRQEKLLVEAAVKGVMNQGADRVMIVDLGPAEGRGESCVQFLGQRVELEERRALIV
jgi:CRISPR-associated protein Cas2